MLYRVYFIKANKTTSPYIRMNLPHRCLQKKCPTPLTPFLKFAHGSFSKSPCFFSFFRTYKITTRAFIENLAFLRPSFQQPTQSYNN
jgi:hypothetical protein